MSNNYNVIFIASYNHSLSIISLATLPGADTPLDSKCNPSVNESAFKFAMAHISNQFTFTWIIENITMGKNLPNDGIIDSPIFSATDCNDQSEIKWFIRLQVAEFTSHYSTLHIFLVGAPETLVSFAGYHLITRDTVENFGFYTHELFEEVTNEVVVGVLKYSNMNYIPALDKWPPVTDALKIHCYFETKGQKKLKTVSEDIHLQKLSDDFSSLFKSGLFSDVHIIVGNVVFKVHKIVLYARCPAIVMDMKEKSDASIVDTISMDIEAPVLKALLVYFYSGKLILPDCHLLPGLYNAIQKYELNILSKQLSFKPLRLSASTVIEATRECFIWPIKNFSSVKRGAKLHSPVADIGSESFQLTLICTEGLGSSDEIKTSIRRISKFITKELWSTCTVSIIGVDGKEEALRSDNYKYRTGREWEFPTFLVKKEAYRKDYQNVSDDTLTLRYDLAISRGEITSSLVEASFKRESDSQGFCDLHKLSRDMLDISCDVFSQQTVFPDISVITRTDTFRAHKAILVARSPELAQRFDSKLNQQPAEEIDLSYVDALTVRRMIQYIYTGKMFSRSYNEIKALYTLADKYKMLALREKCSAGLKTYRQFEKNIETLRLANTYEDEDLKIHTRERIVDNPIQILRSKKWMTLLRQYPELVNEVFFCMANRYKSVILSEFPSVSQIA